MLTFFWSENTPDGSDLSSIDMYRIFCNYQPLPLFPREVSSASLASRDPELVLAIEALGMRFLGKGVKESRIEKQIKVKTKRAGKMAITRLAEGSVELSTIQTLCLLSFLEFTGKLSTNSCGVIG